MIQVSQLNKEERVKEIYMEIVKKMNNSMTFSQSLTTIEPSALIRIIESIEDRVYFISESPSFEFKGINYTCQQCKCDTIEDFKSLMNAHSNEFYIIYSIMLNPGVISNAPGVSQNQSYMIRGVFVQDPLVKREQIINQILGEE
jgi:hypothetical protein